MDYFCEGCLYIQLFHIYHSQSGKCQQRLKKNVFNVCQQECMGEWESDNRFCADAQATSKLPLFTNSESTLVTQMKITVKI